MLSHTTWLVSKMDPIKYIFEKLALTSWIARWQVLLLEYDIVYVTQKATKGNSLAEYLVHYPIEDYQSMQCEFLDEDILALFEVGKYKDEGKWTMLFDGASNAPGYEIRAMLISPMNQLIPFTARLGFDCTNNVAEYEACAMGVRATIKFKGRIL